MVSALHANPNAQSNQFLTRTLLSLNRAQAGTRSPRGPEEAQAPRRPSRGRSSREDNQGCWPQAHIRYNGCSRSRRVPAAQQDSVLAGTARRRQRGGSVGYLWSLRRFPRDSYGAWPKGYCVRRIPGRGWRYQCEGGYFGHDNGRQGYPCHLPETVVAARKKRKYPSGSSGVWRVLSCSYLCNAKRLAFSQYKFSWPCYLFVHVSTCGNYWDPV